MNEQLNRSSVRGLRSLELRDLCHVCHMKGLVCWTFPISALCSIFLSQLHTNFDSSCIQSHATITILTYGVETMEHQHGSIMELRLTEMQCGVKYLL